MKKKPNLSVIIPCFNSQKYLNKCLDSILKSTYKNYELIIVDDCSTDNTPEILKKYQSFSQIKIFRLKKNKGPANARNFGASKTRGQYLFFLDADTETEKSCFDQVVKKFQKDQNIGALQAKLMKSKSRRIETAGHFLSFLGFPYEVRVGENENKNQQEKLIFGARSAGMAVRKKIFQIIGGFDKDYFIYGEETDLSWRVWLAGYKIIYFPKAKVYHFQKSSLNKKTKYRIFYQGAKNNTQNILKNAPLEIIIWMLPLHILGWLALSLKLIFQKRLKMAFYIYQGLFWNIISLRKIIKKRAQINLYKNKNNSAKQIIRGEASFKTILTKGLTWFKNV
ncbi:MAG: glycosyltransferase family 2 protein [Candidatus Shapirobacteria bacterium]